MARMQDDDMLDKELDFKREQMDRAAVASGNVDENSALYRHAKLNGWDLGKDTELHGPARAQAAAAMKWGGVAEQAAKGRMMDARADMMEADADLRAGYDGIVANATAQRLDRARRGRATLGSIVGHAMRNGGMVPRELAQSVGMELGDPGFVGGTLAKDGTFMSLGRGKDGKTISPTGVVSPFDVTKAMVDSGDWKNAQRYVKKFLNGKYTDAQIASTGFSPQWVQSMVNAQASESDKKLQLEGLKLLAEMDKANNGRPIDAAGFFSKVPKLAEAFLEEYDRNEDGSIKMVEGPNGMEPVKVQVSPEVASERALKYFEGLRKAQADGGASGMSETQRALVDGIRALTAPKPVDPNVKAMQERANARANAIDAAGGRQQLIYERKPDGSFVTTNGYVANGRVYDSNGDEMQGEFYQNYVKSDKEGEPGRFVGRIVPAAQPAQGAQGNAPQTFEAGKTYTDRSGKSMLFKGGDPSDRANWEAAPAAETSAVSGPVSDMAQPVGELGGGASPQGKPSPGEQQRTRLKPADEPRKNMEAQKGERIERPQRNEVGRRTRQQTLEKHGATEEIAQQYDGIDRNLTSRVADALEIPYDDLYSGKYDRQLIKYFEREGDANAVAAVEKAGELRRQKQEVDENEAEWSDAKMNAELDEIEKEAIREGWSKQTTDSAKKRVRDQYQAGRIFGVSAYID